MASPDRRLLPLGLTQFFHREEKLRDPQNEFRLQMKERIGLEKYDVISEKIKNYKSWVIPFASGRISLADKVESFFSPGESREEKIKRKTQELQTNLITDIYDCDIRDEDDEYKGFEKMRAAAAFCAFELLVNENRWEDQYLADESVILTAFSCIRSVQKGTDEGGLITTEWIIEHVYPFFFKREGRTVDGFIEILDQLVNFQMGQPNS